MASFVPFLSRFCPVFAFCGILWPDLLKTECIGEQSGVWRPSAGGVQGCPSTQSYTIDRMSQGTIKKLVTDKGFGFIAGDGKELFFHQSSVEGASFDELREGQSVEYSEGQGPKGPRAENVKVV